MDKILNLVTVAKYAASKGVRRQKIYDLIDDGKIIPTLVGEQKFIDLDKYELLDVHAKEEKPENIKSLSRTIKTLRGRVNQLENIVLQKKS